MTFRSVQDISGLQASLAVEMLAIIAFVEGGNDDKVREAWTVAELAPVHRLLHALAVRELTLGVAGAFAPPRNGDQHLRRAMELLEDEQVLLEVARHGDEASLRKSLEMWRKLCDDEECAVVVHARNKVVAHMAELTRDLPKYGNLFRFTRDLVAVIQAFAKGCGAIDDDLGEYQVAKWGDSFERFWLRGAKPAERDPDSPVQTRYAATRGESG